MPCPSYGRCTNGGDPMTSTPTPEPGERLCPWCDHVHDLNADAPCGFDGCPCGTILSDRRPPTPGEGAGRPLPEFQMVACADHMLTGHRWRCRACRREVERQFQECCEEMWRLQRTTPAPPASPADDVPDADAVAFQNGYRIGVRVGSEHHGPCRGLPPASPVPPTPTPCPYIVTGGEGTSYCSLAERSAMHAAAPPSTPAEQPEPDGGAA